MLWRREEEVEVWEVKRQCGSGMEVQWAGAAPLPCCPAHGMSPATPCCLEVVGIPWRI